MCCGQRQPRFRRSAVGKSVLSPCFACCQKNRTESLGLHDSHTSDISVMLNPEWIVSATDLREACVSPSPRASQSDEVSASAGNHHSRTLLHIRRVVQGNTSSARTRAAMDSLGKGRWCPPFAKADGENMGPVFSPLSLRGKQFHVGMIQKEVAAPENRGASCCLFEDLFLLTVPTAK